MTPAPPPRLLEAIAVVMRGAAAESVGAHVSVAEASALLAPWLTDLLEALDAGLVTELEVAGALVDRFAVGLVSLVGLPLVETLSSTWEAAVAQVCVLLEQRDRSGPTRGLRR